MGFLAVLVNTEGNMMNDNDIISVIRASIAPGASDDQLRYFLAVAEKTGLDPVTGQIKFLVLKRKMPNGMYVDAVQPYVGIDGFRSLAERSGKYAGQVGPWWCGPDGKWREVWLEKIPPAAAKVGVLRTDFREPIFAVATWEQYAQLDKQGSPSRVWATHGPLMLAKCAEALALRRAFPLVLSGLYSEEEVRSFSEVPGTPSLTEAQVAGFIEPPQTQVPDPESAGRMRAVKAWARLRPLIRERNLSDEQIREYINTRFKKQSSAELTDDEWAEVTNWIASHENNLSE